MWAMLIILRKHARKWAQEAVESGTVFELLLYHWTVIEMRTVLLVKPGQSSVRHFFKRNIFERPRTLHE